MLTGMVSTPAVMPPDMSPLRRDRPITVTAATVSVGIRAAILVEPDRRCPRCFVGKEKLPRHDPEHRGRHARGGTPQEALSENWTPSRKGRSGRSLSSELSTTLSRGMTRALPAPGEYFRQ